VWALIENGRSAAFQLPAAGGSRPTVLVQKSEKCFSAARTINLMPEKRVSRITQEGYSLQSLFSVEKLAVLVLKLKS
jgi:hypothetical protein